MIASYGRWWKRGDDVQRILKQHRRAFWRQWQWPERMVWGGCMVVLACPLIGLAIGLAIWGWPK